MSKKVIKKKFNFTLVITILVIILVAIALVLLWSNYIKRENCKDWQCFSSNLEKCTRAKFTNDNGMIFEYNIIEKSDNNCLINVKLLQGDLTDEYSTKLEDKSMICSIPFGVVMLPESNIKNCHGLLKETLQEEFISKLHTYIVQNVGQINMEILPVPEE